MSEQDISVVSVSNFNLEQYLGLWYEIGRLPLRWEDNGAKNVTASYSMNPDGTVRVDNRCINEKGKPEQAIAQATPVAGQTGQLKVSFLPEALRWIPFTKGDYWVIKLDENYRFALVGTPDHKNAWLLSRTATIAPQTQSDYQAAAWEQGFDLSNWIVTPQDGSRVTDPELTK